jgi:isopropylmalate/homocitrate/citramalate synthase
MAELIIKVPDELEELESASEINWQLAVEKRLKEEFEELAKLKKIVAKSELTEEQAKELADEVNLSLAKRYEKLLKSK